jgi:hypothetical protein
MRWGCFGSATYLLIDLWTDVSTPSSLVGISSWGRRVS